jgi:DNA-nicking Smr family endonuclease
MNFGLILDQWERLGMPLAEGALGYNKDKELDAWRESPSQRRRRLLRKPPDGTIDLHGLTQDEAWDALCGFFDSARARGLEKVLIIHGKGNGGGPETSGVLKNITRSFIERCSFAGESGQSAAPRGGAGSTWVLLKN